MCQQSHAGDVANGPQAVAHAQVGVDRDAARVGLDADCVEADPVHPGAPACSEQQVVASHLAAVTECQDEVLAVASGGRCLGAQLQLDSVAAEHLAQRLAQRRRLMGQHAFSRFNDDHLAAQTAHGLGHLDADRPAPQYQQATRHGLHSGDLAVAPDALQVGEAGYRWHDGIRAGRDDDVRRAVGRSVHFDHTRTGQPTSAAQEVDTPPASQCSWPVSE